MQKMASSQKAPLAADIVAQQAADDGAGAGFASGRDGLMAGPFSTGSAPGRGQKAPDRVKDLMLVISASSGSISR